MEIHVRRACPVWGNEESIRRILSNLISNAVRYGAAGRYLGIVLEQQKDGACVRVQDRGQGIAPEALSHIFDRLYTPEDSAAVLWAAAVWDWPSQRVWRKAWAARCGLRARWEKERRLC